MSKPSEPIKVTKEAPIRKETATFLEKSNVTHHSSSSLASELSNITEDKSDLSASLKHSLKLPK